MISREERRGGRREGKERGMQAGVWCYYTGRFHHSHPSFLPSCTSRSGSRSLSRIHTTTPTPTPTPQILRDSRHASQCPPRHTPDPLTPVCQVPPTSLKQGIWLHSECNREAMWDRRSARSVPGITREISKTEIESTRRKEEKKNSFITLSHSHKAHQPLLPSYSS